LSLITDTHGYQDKSEDNGGSAVTNQGVQVCDKGKKCNLAPSKSRSKKLYKSASVVESDTGDEEAGNSESESSQDDESNIVAFPRIPSPKANENDYFREKRENMERNAALFKALDLQNAAKALFNNSKGGNRGSKKQKARPKVGGYMCSRNTVVLIQGTY
jgi:hypothetical protein